MSIVILIMLIWNTASVSGPLYNRPSENIRIIESNEYTMNDVVTLAESVAKTGVNTIIYSNTPSLVSKQEKVYDVALNLENGTFIELSSRSIAKKYFKYHYAAILSNRTISTYTYLTSSNRFSHFENKLQDRITRLKMLTPQLQKVISAADYWGDDGAIDEYWVWDNPTEIETDHDRDDDGYTYQTNCKWIMYRAEYDYKEYYQEPYYRKWWQTDWIITSKVDEEDYILNYWDRVGYWIEHRNLVADAGDEYIWDHYPTEPVGTWQYTIGTSVKITPTGPVLDFGLSKTWSGTDVTITDKTDEVHKIAEWEEGFRGPNHSIWPLLGAPCSASHNTFNSYRGTIWYTGSDDWFEFDIDYEIQTRFDDSFYIWNYIWLRYTIHRHAWIFSGYIPYSPN
jgi:hypothetical protein